MTKETVKARKDREAREEERSMRDRMNGIIRDSDGKITHRNWKPLKV